ncbi:MAG TPA: S8 family peptidase, partial [Herpetosiphonaceae bacterium]
ASSYAEPAPDASALPAAPQLGGGAQLTYPSLATGAAQLHAQGIDGTGVTVAIIDSGMPSIDRTWVRMDSTTLAFSDHGSFIVYKDLVAPTATVSADPYGHGTHILGTIADKRPLPKGTVTGGKQGIAPGANLVMVRALDAQGQAPYSRVIEGIDWLIANKTALNLKVLNLSLQAPIHGPYWHDPLAQATMAAWAEGITVVAAAGNQGPAPATIAVPGNVPYVITVGALRPGAYTGSGVDELAPYSSAGPTESKFAKPDVVIAGSRVIAPLARGSALESQAGLAKERVRLDMRATPSRDELNYYYLSGTSMAAAEVSGIVALLLDDEPTLSNNQVKYRLSAAAKAAGAADGTAMYSIWQQGAGRVNAVDVVNGTSTQAANAGMDIALDRDHENGTHYLGSAAYDEATGTFYVEGQPVAGGSYQSWAGSYQSWAGNANSWAGSYQSWAGSYQSWAGSYQSWAGSYQSWAGSYQSWAGSYQSWAGSTSVWDTSYQSWAGNLVQEP